jgi:2-oxoisovalerate dehydrogenase E1 component alpha subunit
VQLEKELDAHVTACWKEAESYGTLSGGPALDPLTMFEDVYKEMPPNLVQQREELRQLMQARAQARPVAQPQAKEG